MSPSHVLGLVLCINLWICLAETEDGIWFSKRCNFSCSCFSYLSAEANSILNSPISFPNFSWLFFLKVCDVFSTPFSDFNAAYSTPVVLSVCVGDYLFPFVRKTSKHPVAQRQFICLYVSKIFAHYYIVLSTLSLSPWLSKILGPILFLLWMVHAYSFASVYPWQSCWLHQFYCCIKGGTHQGLIRVWHLPVSEPC